MQDIINKIENANWQSIPETMHQNGYAVLSDLLSDAQREWLKAAYGNPDFYKKTVVMAHHRFGLGEYKYFNYPLMQAIRTNICPRLAPIANAWFCAFNMDTPFPRQHVELQEAQQNNYRPCGHCMKVEYKKWKNGFI